MFIDNMKNHKTQIMGILNVTPDSFSDGGDFASNSSIVRQVKKMEAEGADIIDVGGESTRPFAGAVSEIDELQRVIPAIEAIRVFTDIPISVDTTKAEVAKQALRAGANMVNDISALRHDPAMVKVVKSYDEPVIIMHMQGTPADMQVAPAYDVVMEEICDFFKRRIGFMVAEGIDKKRIILDPGIGFGKTCEHNLTILGGIDRLKQLGCPVLIGHSRKSFMEKFLGLSVAERDCPTAVISALLAGHGVDILRVHAVGLNRQAVMLAGRIGVAQFPGRCF